MIMSDVNDQSKEAPAKNDGGQSLSGVTILELRIFHCRYIVGEVLFCGVEIHRSSYCSKHYALCYVTPRPAPAVGLFPVRT